MFGLAGQHARGAAPAENLAPGDQRLSQLDVDDPQLPPKAANAYRILYIGDSITRHGTSKSIVAKLGWDHVAGMAASTEAKDYAHLLGSRLQEALPDKKIELSFHGKGGSGKVAERLSALAGFAALSPDLVVIQLGEHEREPQGAAVITDGLRQIFRQLAAWQPRPRVLCTGVWNPYGKGERHSYSGWTLAVENALKAACEAEGVPFVPVQKYALNPECSGSGTSAGVQWHPNDKGMQGYADELFAAWQQAPATAPAKDAAAPAKTPAKDAAAPAKTPATAPKHALSPGPAAPLPARVTIDPRQVRGPVNRLVFGQNIEAADSYGISRLTHNYSGSTTGYGLWDPAKAAPEPAALALTRDMGPTMIRYPGGCFVHNFEWKDTVGPVAERPNFTFGLNEYLAFCQASKAVPLITVSAERCSPQSAAELVDYLNAPADTAHPWAQKRAAWGHPAPFGVAWFELGNESDHGTHLMKDLKAHTASSYCEWAKAAIAAMRAVDPTVKIGVHAATSKPPEDPWNLLILKELGGLADYLAIHTYYVGVGRLDAKNPAQLDLDRVMRACLANGPQAAAWLARYRSVVRQQTGRDLPLAVTEFNAGFVQEKPQPLRFTLGAALLAADYQRELLDPDHQVLLACYWQYFRGYWGPVREQRGDTWTLMPAYHLFRLWHQHFGTRLLNVQTQSPTLAFEGYGGTGLASPEPELQSLAVLPLQLRAPASAKGFRLDIASDRELSVALAGYSGDAYPVLATLPARGGCGYRVRAEARLEGRVPPGVVLGLGLSDSRGWDQTFSACGAEGAEAATDWLPLSADLATLPDCSSLALVLRLRAGKETLAPATLHLRNLTVERLPAFPPYPVLTAAASLDDAGQTLYLIVFNKHPQHPLRTVVSLADGSGLAARQWTVTGPNLLADNRDGGTQVGEKISGAPVAATPEGFALELPPYSMTALEIQRR